ncbi:hypothetical protein SynBIOSU31_00924 [Synechococcus sp. BIOS-U3-1]|uniref:hypothetical protein n=1 Tax=Synechococcus sp. BIOS-U3-1 TaxID=1400865 RepID=UPI0016444012|nr:hypothetical protein [Synechococcus sp. BIOS-U3-1]QNI57807.1 hypothetical protein SynBIOSU31_00924 [Synechococcus sp. BIOS-U3-1]
MSFLSDLEGIVKKIEAPFEQPISGIDHFFDSIGSEILNAENEILDLIKKDFTKAAAPLIQGLSALIPVSEAETITSDPFNRWVQYPMNANDTALPGLKSPGKSIIIDALADASSTAPRLTFTPTFSIKNQDVYLHDNYYRPPELMYNGLPPTFENNSLAGGFTFSMGCSADITLELGMNLEIDISEAGTFPLPSFGLSAGKANEGKKKLGQFQDSDGVISLSGGVGFGGSITSKSEDSIRIELGVTLLCSPKFNFEATINDFFKLDADDIKNVYGEIAQGGLLSQQFWKDSPLTPKYETSLDAHISVGFIPTFKAFVNNEPVDLASPSKIKDALTGLEIDLNINPGFTGSIGVILKEENTGVTPAAVNVPITLGNDIKIGFDADGMLQITDAISLDAGLNLQALGVSILDTLSLPGFIWDIGSITEPLGTVNLLDPGKSEGFNHLSTPQFVPSGELTFEGIQLTAS